MAVWFISRHQGAIDWVKQQSIHIDHFVSHLDTQAINANDIVIGTLPVNLAAQVCQQGARFYFLSANLTADQRGTELSAEQLTQQGCSLQPFFVQKL